MIITRTPFRVSFFGGGTDYSAWYKTHGGAVLSTSIDKYCYISCRQLPPFFEHKHRIVYSKIENVRDIYDIQHPAVRNVMNWLGVSKGLEIHHDGDLPARSGLGSSSSFTVGLINAIKALNGEHISKRELASSAIHIEQEIIKENVGSQDQIAASFGGFNKIEFFPSGGFEVSPVVISKEREEALAGHLMLFFTGFSRIASDIAKAQIDNMSNRESELKRMHSMVEESISILGQANSNIEEFGRLLNETWQYKRSLSDRISNPAIDNLYSEAVDAGAIGGKILGAGGGGFLLLFVPPQDQPKVRKALCNLVHVPFKFEKTGSCVVLYQPQGL